jgi:ArsR family transcriptional regulator
MNLSETLKILADETRFKIVEFLLERDYCVGALAGRLGISDAAVSQHLQILRKGGLIKGEKRGYWTHYSVETERLNEMAGKLVELADSAANRQSGCWREISGKPDGRRNSMCKCNCEHPEKLKDTS